MASEDQADVKPGEIVIKCKNAPHKPGSTKFSKCEKEEICAKIKSVQAQIKSGDLVKKNTKAQDYKDNRAAGNKICDQLKGYAKRESDQHENLGGFKHLSKDCNEKLTNKAKNADPPYTGFSPDHVQEIQLGGHPTNLTNLRWMSSGPNSWMGTKMRKVKTSGPNKTTKITGDCC